MLCRKHFNLRAWDTKRCTILGTTWVRSSHTRSNPVGPAVAHSSGDAALPGCHLPAQSIVQRQRPRPPRGQHRRGGGWGRRAAAIAAEVSPGCSRGKRCGGSMLCASGSSGRPPQAGGRAGAHPTPLTTTSLIIPPSTLTFMSCCSSVTRRPLGGTGGSPGRAKGAPV